MSAGPPAVRLLSGLSLIHNKLSYTTNYKIILILKERSIIYW